MTSAHEIFDVRIAYLANELIKLDKYKISFVIPNGIRIKPSLKVQKDNMVFNVEISADSFCKESKLAQNRSNIHFEWWNSEDETDSIVPPPTPLYNSLISQDLGRQMEEDIYQDWL